MGAIESGRWHASHFAWKIGATSLVNVGTVVGSAAIAASGAASNPLKAIAPSVMPRQVQLFRFDIR
jgi:hypothetical protein